MANFANITSIHGSLLAQDHATGVIITLADPGPDATHCRLVLTRPPRFTLETRLRDDRFLRGPQGWAVDCVAVQGHDLPAAALITFGDAWHGNHHAWPGSARLGVEKGQADPGWSVLLALRRVGLVHGLRSQRTWCRGRG